MYNIAVENNQDYVFNTLKELNCKNSNKINKGGVYAANKKF